MDCEAIADQSKRARIDSTTGVGVSDGMLQEILSTVRNTDCPLKKMGR